MHFNVDTFKVMHIGNNNDKEKYEMNGTRLEEVIEGRDLGVIMRNNMIWKEIVSVLKLWREGCE